MKVLAIIACAALTGFASWHPLATARRVITTKDSGDSSLTIANGVQLSHDVPFTGNVRERFPNGSMKRETAYVNGKRDGTEHGWFENGAVRETRTYRTGREEGIHRGWYANGTRRFVYHYLDGRGDGLMEEWYESGLPYTRFEYVHGQEEGAQRMWTENGVLRANYVVVGGRRYGLMGTTGCQGTPHSTEASSQ